MVGCEVPQAKKYPGSGRGHRYLLRAGSFYRYFLSTEWLLASRFGEPGDGKKIGIYSVRVRKTKNSPRFLFENCETFSDSLL